MPLITYASSVSAYFVGFGVGATIFFMPDKLGRKGTMAIVLPLFALAATVSLRFDDLRIKAIAFFF